MNPEVGSRAIYRGIPVVVTEHYPHGGYTGHWWRVDFRRGKGFGSMVVHEDALQDLQPPPEFEVGEKVYLGAYGWPAVVEDIDDSAGRRRYVVNRGPEIRASGILIEDRRSVVGPEHLNL